ncbi:hypothetical protein GCM10007874_65690 [Labrys miyagiensis]|uniref:4a-hydroxytetrahydrobiopterin dehydratase n=2 Tax=Labrys miyagiensis TaxID=346912 RepID=A0ABQ6CTA7_9HYPH|nr:hypothetical protein GCM10007874_65690 [Labrys miyagiensis]
MEELASWLQEEEGIDVLLWTDRQAFPIGSQLLDRLVELSQTVDAAVFIFGEDDKIWYRNQEEMQPRDNVLLEYGLFASRLGWEKSIVCRINKSKTSSDLAGLTVLNLQKGREIDTRLRLRSWVRDLSKKVEKEKEHSTKIRSLFPLTPDDCDHVSRRLIAREIAAELEMLPEWTLAAGVTMENPPRPTRELVRKYEFRSFAEAIRFMGECVEELDSINHHPKWLNIWKSLIVSMSTWNIGHDVSLIDIKVAHFLDKRYNKGYRFDLT